MKKLRPGEMVQIKTVLLQTVMWRCRGLHLLANIVIFMTR